MAINKSADKGGCYVYSLIYNRDTKGFVIKYPNLQQRSNYLKTTDVFDIYIDDSKNIYFCRQFDFCCFCGKQSTAYIFGTPVCRRCLKRLKQSKFDDNEVMNNAEND